MAMGDASPRPEPGQPVTAQHYRDRMPTVAPLLHPRLHPAGPLWHIAQYSHGVLDFAVTSPAWAALAHPGDEGTLAAIDEPLSFTVTRLDHRLTGAGTGDLIRLVLQADTGAFICDSVVPNLHLIGAVLCEEAAGAVAYPRGRPEVDRADRALANLARTLRERRSLTSSNLGGFDENEASGTAGAETGGASDNEASGTAGAETGGASDNEASGTAGAETGGVPGGEAGGVTPSAPVVRTFGARDHPVAGLLSGVLAAEGVHYAAYHRGGSMPFQVDMFDDASLTDFFGCLISPSARRRFYWDLGGELPVVAADLSRTVCAALKGSLTRVVLDVEQGAVYYVPLGDADYLVGVTLKQRRVREADVALDRVAVALTTMPDRSGTVARSTPSAGPTGSRSG